VLCLDVNVLLNAFNEHVARHREYTDLVNALANGSEPVGIPHVVASGFLRRARLSQLTVRGP
jgi:uncharacterized protein